MKETGGILGLKGASCEPAVVSQLERGESRGQV